MTERLALVGAHLADGTTATVVVDAASGLVAQVGGAVPDGVRVLDLTGHVLLPAPAEPHAHLDKAFTADRVHNPTGDLMGAIVAWSEYRLTLTVEDLATRAELGARRLLANGCTAIRTHVDVGGGVGTRAVEAMQHVRTALDGLVDVQVVALVATPTSGPDGAANRDDLEAALEAGADVVGGCPHIDPDPAAVIEHCVRLAAATGRPLDLHMDETLDAAVLGLEVLCDQVEVVGLRTGVTASHCVSLGMQDPATQDRLAARCAALGISVVTLPQTNLYLQGRQVRTAVPRGLTAIRPLLDAGVVVAGGGDNLQDLFNLMGRGDPLEAAALLVAAGHLAPLEAYAAVSVAARSVMGLAAGALVPAAGDPADLVALPSPGLRAAVADAPPRRFVLRAGRVAVDPGRDGP